jgi:hypothetical protein
MANLRAPVQATPARPPRYSLLAAAPTVSDPDLRPLAGGWSYQPEACGNSGISEIACAGNVDVMSPAVQPSTIDGDPVWIWAGDECSTFGFDSRDWEGRARRQLAATESFRLAAELWDGAVANAASLSNRWLAGSGSWSDTVTSGPSAVTTALANIEAGLASVLFGQQGMIHVTPQVLTHLVDRGSVIKEGAVWVSPMGHIVVADAGYSGDGPDADAADATSQWMYGTALLSVVLGPVEIIPGSLEDARGLAQAMDRSVNDIAVFAARPAGVRWASHCGFVAAEVNVPVALIGGVS